MYIFVEMFEQKRQDLIAQQSQEVTTETTTVATASGAAPNVNEGIASIYNYIYTRTYKQLHIYYNAIITVMYVCYVAEWLF